MVEITDLSLRPEFITLKIQNICRSVDRVDLSQALEKDSPLPIANSAIFLFLESPTIENGPYRDGNGNICCTLHKMVAGRQIYLSLAIRRVKNVEIIEVLKIEEG